MAKYRHRETGEVKSKLEWEKHHSNTSFPNNWNADILDSLSLDNVFSSPRPDPTSEYKLVYVSGYTQDEKGDWYEDWSEKDKFVDYVDGDNNTITAASQIIEYENNKLKVEESGVRAKRDMLLSSDIDVINAVRWNSFTTEQQAAWTQYRQDLLNIPQQQGFPFNVTWPTKPE